MANSGFHHNRSIAVENAGKTVLSLFGVTPKTHDPARQLAILLQNQSLSQEVQQKMQQMLPDLLALGSSEHFITDYGDETTYTLPWDLFTKVSATDALEAARRLVVLAQAVVAEVIK